MFFGPQVLAIDLRWWPGVTSRLRLAPRCASDMAWLGISQFRMGNFRERFSRKMWNFPWNFPWFFSNMWNNHGFFHGFSMAFPPLFLCFSGFCKWTGCACWGDPLGSARRSWAGPGEQLPWRDGFYIPCGKLTYLWNITIFNGKTHYKWAIFNSYVSLPEGSTYE